MVPITFNLFLIINIICNNLKCKFCGSNRINKRGKQKYNGKQRYLCREARRQGDESLLSITNEWLKARVFAKVPKRLKGARSTKPNRNKLA